MFFPMQRKKRLGEATEMSGVSVPSRELVFESLLKVKNTSREVA